MIMKYHTNYSLLLAAALTLVCLLVPLAVLLIGKARLLKGKVEV